MPTFASPTYAVELRHRSNCARIACAQSGKEIPVFVRPKGDASAKLIEARGILSNDGKSFSIVVQRVDGAQYTQDLSYRDLLKALSEVEH
jgi:hypothetical protein